MSNYPVQDFIYKHFPWTCIFYARRNYGYSYPILIRAWREARAQAGARDDLFGDLISHAGAFFSILAERARDEAVQYACVEGTCTVIWHPTRGNQGGLGVPGCPCDDMDDPRDLVRGPLSS